MWIRQKRAALGGLAMAATAFGVAIPSLAAADTAPASPDPAVVVVGSDAHAEDGGELSCEVLFGGEFVDGEFVDGDWEEWVPSAEELAEINAETDDLVAFLAENGVSVEVETDDLGFRFPAFDENTDEAVFDLVDEFFAERYGDEGWLIDEADLADLEDGECYFEDDHDHETDHETGYGVEYGGVELDLSDEELAELAEDFDLEVEELVELIDLLIG